MSLEKIFEREIVIIEDYLSAKFSETSNYKGVQGLQNSIKYSLGSGGKRFRPVLSFLTAKTLGQSFEKILGFSAAVEYIHTYSLIHDDLPCMDNDEERRGHPTNHVKYGEAVALLAGDSLLTHAFHELAVRYKEEPEILSQLVLLLSEAAGVYGMIGGQAMDIEEKERSLEELSKVHELKTGALIRVSIEGAAVACGASSKDVKNLREFGELLGFAFQLADDVLDYDPKQPENTSYVSLMGLEETQNKLKSVTEEALSLLESWGESSGDLKKLTQFNFERARI